MGYNAAPLERLVRLEGQKVSLQDKYGVDEASGAKAPPAWPIRC